MADATNQGIPAAGGQLSGDASRQAAIRRMKKLAEGGAPKQPGPPAGTIGPPVAKGY